MNNQNIIKYLCSNKNSKFSFIQTFLHDQEITNYYNKGYFDPYEYDDYMNRVISYNTMMSRYASRMNYEYYYDYVSGKYGEGYLEDNRWEYYERVFDGFYYEGTISYDRYIEVLEQTLKRINYNILRYG